MTPDQTAQIQQIQRLEGLGLTPDLAAAEASSWRRFIPGATPWRAVEAFETEIAALEKRRRAVEAEQAATSERLRTAPERDLEALARWERDGRRDSRPEPSRAGLEVELAGLQASQLALLKAIDGVSESRATYVAKHRARLTRDAGGAAERAHTVLVAAIGELERARAELVAARRLELWTACYPDASAGREPQWGSLAGGQRRALEPMGARETVAVAPVLTALRTDADWLTSAASPEQRAKLAPRAASQEEHERARDRQLDARGSLHRQASQDARRGELDRMRGRI